SDSMQPAIPMGSVVIVRAVDPETLEVGDVISFTSSVEPYPTLTHRITAISRGQDGRLGFKTKGDFTPIEDSWELHYTAKAGLVTLSLPLVGYLMAAVSTTAGRAILGLAFAAVAGFAWLSLVWRRPVPAGAALDKPALQPSPLDKARSGIV